MGRILGPVDLGGRNTQPQELSGDNNLLGAYNGLVARGALQDDGAQRAVLEQLMRISDQLGASSNNGGLAGFFRRRRSAPKGLYLWGGVGGGKTLLMDLFFETAPTAFKQRVHFHEFMDKIHQSVAKIRAKSTKAEKEGDPIAQVVKPIIKEVRLLCFDEFHVNDITNAMLLGRLFEKFFAAGMVVVATSNVPPEGLYKDGLNRALFLPFIDLIKSHCEVEELGAARDYRLDKLSSQPVFHFGSAPQTQEAMNQIWRKLTGGQAGQPGVVVVLGREIKVPSQAMGAARFAFGDLCEQPLGARDYLAICNAFHTLMIDNIPQFSRDSSNAAKRFILLVDTLYDRGVKLAASFEAPLEALSGDRDTAFEFRRCESRLREMASDAYLSAPRKMEV